MATETMPTGRGFLQVRVSTAGDALPVKNATVTITEQGKDGAAGKVLYSTLTDRSGLTPLFSLPAPPASVGEQPGLGVPYTEYRVEVSADRFISQIFEGVPVFSGVTTVQPATLTPAGTTQPAPERFPPYSSTL